jgi:hypothetical protein
MEMEIRCCAAPWGIATRPAHEIEEAILTSSRSGQQAMTNIRSWMPEEPGNMAAE